MFFFFKQKTAYEMRISDWSSDVCSSDLAFLCRADRADRLAGQRRHAGKAGEENEFLPDGAADIGRGHRIEFRLATGRGKSLDARRQAAGGLAKGDPRHAAGMAEDRKRVVEGKRVEVR